MSTFTITSKDLTIEDLRTFLASDMKLEISAEAKETILANRRFLEKKIAEPKARYYGINTGFGALCDVEIAPDQLEQLQENLVMSHACGMGEEVKKEVVKLMFLLKVKGLSLGYSGISNETVEQLVKLYNNDIYPIVYEYGSLGASGDLAPLAHLCLPLLGMGAVRENGQKKDSVTVLKEKGLSPIKLKAKEGLALLNGTQFMSAWGCYSIIEAERMQRLAELTAAVSIDAYDAQLAPFHSEIHRVRRQPGQMTSAANVAAFLSGSEIISRPKEAVQDPYSFRCVPQVYGAVRQAVGHVKGVLENEINAVTDNPLLFEKENLIVSGGNFHGEPLALALDYLGIAMCEIGSISERRTYLLLSGKRGLPKFLVADSGLNSGFMIPQYTAASIVSANKQLASPASVDSITSSDGQEDHVSMGANAAVKAYKIIANVERVLAIEFMTAMQALDFRRPLKSSPVIEKIRADYRALVPHYDKDRVMHDDMVATVEFMRGILF
jgi:histidine ammonia-lyase